MSVVTNLLSYDSLSSKKSVKIKIVSKIITVYMKTQNSQFCIYNTPYARCVNTYIYFLLRFLSLAHFLAFLSNLQEDCE